MIRVAVVDDDMYICSKIENILLAYGSVSTVKFETEVFVSGEELIEFINEEHDFDLIFMDIEMNGLTGIEVGKSIRNELQNQLTQIVYVTGRDGYERQLFKVRPFDFVRKPIIDNEIITILETYIRLYSRMNEFFEFRHNRQLIKIPFKDILYFYSENKKVMAVLIDEKISFYDKLSNVSKKLPCEFMVIHQSFIINKTYISKYRYDNITMQNGENLSISQAYRKNVRKLVSMKNDNGKEFFYV